MGTEDAYIDAIYAHQRGQNAGPVGAESGSLNHRFLRAARLVQLGQPDRLIELCRQPLGVQGEIGDGYDSFRTGAVAIGAQAGHGPCFKRLNAEASFLGAHETPEGDIVCPGDRLYWKKDVYTRALVKWLRTGKHGLRPKQYAWTDPTFGIRQLERLRGQTGFVPDVHRADLVRISKASGRLLFIVTTDGRASVLIDGWPSTNHTAFATSWGPHRVVRLSPSSGDSGQTDTRMIGPTRVWLAGNRIHAEGLAQTIDKKLRPLEDPRPWSGSIPMPGEREIGRWLVDENGPLPV